MLLMMMMWPLRPQSRGCWGCLKHLLLLHALRCCRDPWLLLHVAAGA
jgi:hypothetical protein